MKIVIASAFHGGSHEAWASGFARHSRNEVGLVTLPAQFWKWRMQGAAQVFAPRIRAMAGRTDVLLATDMCDLATLLGLTRGPEAPVAAAAYFHENQLT